MKNALKWTRHDKHVSTTAPVAVRFRTTSGALIDTTVRFRVDGRGGSWRVDVAKPLMPIWEAIDNGDALASISEAKAYAARYLAAIRFEFTLSPRSAVAVSGAPAKKIGVAA